MGEKKTNSGLIIAIIVVVGLVVAGLFLFGGNGEVPDPVVDPDDQLVDPVDPSVSDDDIASDLPVYPGAELVTEFFFNWIYVADDSPEDVLAYYQNQLADFIFSEEEYEGPFGNTIPGTSMYVLENPGLDDLEEEDTIFFGDEGSKVKPMVIHIYEITPEIHEDLMQSFEGFDEAESARILPMFSVGRTVIMIGAI